MRFTSRVIGCETDKATIGEQVERGRGASQALTGGSARTDRAPHRSFTKPSNQI
jgi:hypothetical protein